MWLHLHAKAPGNLEQSHEHLTKRNFFQRLIKHGFATTAHGGFKHSGHGNDLSAEALEGYTRMKHVMSYTAR